ncbi:MAG TPA: hypothetical protein VGZ69_07290 [Candidatus Rhabdochlamydia sp.]|jgi:hypothetical protein|nr:hypothetical protein [Candidatus Rhabdochlamydia sp.]
MLPLSVLERTATSILYEIPPGKPDPKQKRTIGEDTRNRIPQLAYKGNTCWYYTLKFIRQQIGKNPCKELTQARKVERLCSLRRKSYTKHENSLPAIADQLFTEKGSDVLCSIDLAKAKNYVKNKQTTQPMMETPEFLEGRPSLFPFLEEFIKEGKKSNMHEFLLHKKFSGRNRINLEFLTNLGISLKEVFDSEITTANGYEKKPCKTLKDLEKSSLLGFFACKISAKVYDLQKSSWTPFQKIDCLIEELETKGPLYVGGNLGRPTYVDEPFKMSQKISERDIYAWRPGANRNPGLGHTVLLVGAKKVQGKAFVYFIDSADPSDPNDRSKQKIYMISYTNLTSNVCDLHGRGQQNSPVGYAYHGTFKVH